jgi:hypothetical protein
MEFIRRRSKLLGVMALLLTVGGIAIAAGRPRAVTIPVLGAEWQCSRTLLVLTSCSRSPVSRLPRLSERNGALDSTRERNIEGMRLAGVGDPTASQEP